MKKVLEKITNKHLFFAMLTGFALSLLPVLLLAFFNYPNADDFSAGVEARHAWVETGSLWEVLKAAAGNVKYNYMEWSGVFASVFWTSLQPGLFGEAYYGLTTWITVAAVCGGAGYLFTVFLRKYLRGDRYVTGCVTLLFLFLLLHCMPDGKEGLYWHAGAVNYTLAYGFLLLLLGLELSLFREINRKKQWVKCIAACVLAVCVGGGNLITALWGSLTVTGIWMVLTVYASRRRGDVRAAEESAPKHAGAAGILPVLTLLCSFAVSVLAPGNSVRMGSSSGMHPVKAVLVSLYYGLDQVFEMWITWPMVCLLALTIPFFWQLVGRVSFSFPMPGMAALLGYGLSCAAFTPSLYATGNLMAGRLQDTAYYIWLLTVFCVILYCIGWMRKQWEASSGAKKENNGGSSALGLKGRIYAVSLALFWAAGSLLTAGVKEEIYVGTQALTFLTNGQAVHYRRQQKERIAVLEDTGKPHAELKTFDNPPELLLFQDISEDKNDWINRAVAEYYYKESVVLKKTEKDDE